MPAARSDQKKNREETKTQRLSRSGSRSEGNQRQLSSNQSRSDQCRSSGHSGDRQGYAADQVRSAITKELRHIGPQGHDAYAPVPLSSLTLEERRSIFESRWVIGPCLGSELKGWVCAKGFKQVISRDDKYASTPHSTTLKLILLTSQIHQWEIAVLDIASAFPNTPVGPSKPPIFVQAPCGLQYSEQVAWRLKHQLYGLRDAPKSWQAHFSQIMVNKGMVQRAWFR